MSIMWADQDATTIAPMREPVCLPWPQAPLALRHWVLPPRHDFDGRSGQFGLPHRPRQCGRGRLGAVDSDDTRPLLQMGHRQQCRRSPEPLDTVRTGWTVGYLVNQEQADCVAGSDEESRRIRHVTTRIRDKVNFVRVRPPAGRWPQVQRGQWSVFILVGRYFGACVARPRMLTANRRRRGAARRHRGLRDGTLIAWLAIGATIAELPRANAAGLLGRANAQVTACRVLRNSRERIGRGFPAGVRPRTSRRPERRRPGQSLPDPCGGPSAGRARLSRPGRRPGHPGRPSSTRSTFPSRTGSSCPSR